MGLATVGMATSKAEVLFYHLERQPLDKVLPTMLERVVERGWRAVVQCGSQERLDALDLSLWTYKDESFLAHGTRKDGFNEAQPIFLTTDDANPNRAGVRFLVDGAVASGFDGYARVVYLFDGHDAQALATAREQWKAARGAGCAVTYWQQSPEGRWEKRA